MKGREVMLGQFPKFTFQSNSKTKTVSVIRPPGLIVHTPKHKRCQIIQNGMGKAAQRKGVKLKEERKLPTSK